MTFQHLLEQALYSSAIIHQPHALKAYLSTKFLCEYLDCSEKLLVQVSRLIEQDALKISCNYTDTVQQVNFSSVRRHRILERGIYPASYQAMSQWHDEKGFTDIFQHYVSRASRHSEYLSHNVTILLALNEVYKLLSPDSIPIFLNRLTEFVTSTFIGEEHQSELMLSTPNREGDILNACLEQPGFFGHNLITLAWIIRCKDRLSNIQYESMLCNLNIQAVSPLEDPDDELDSNIWNLCWRSDRYEDFRAQIESLVFENSVNLHQITLADALCFLQNQYPEQTARLARVADYQTRMCAK
ncbi:hypothetical protein G6364_17460 [Vibrio cholerae]|uniref:hypothetical protein n=1 Tax=Vibrio cholerae TaxID=666 RepID=UPI00053C6B9F|nr:hypothetical protein [Vibrio cholerae]HDY7846245.1 hypothetical protein [Vibrio vulnificus]HDY7873928.1 hypothetical protein [Vibrio vulnificus]